MAVSILFCWVILPMEPTTERFWYNSSHRTVTSCHAFTLGCDCLPGCCICVCLAFHSEQVWLKMLCALWEWFWAQWQWHRCCSCERGWVHISDWHYPECDACFWEHWSWCGFLSAQKYVFGGRTLVLGHGYLLGTMSLVLGHWYLLYQVIGTRSLALGHWYQVIGTWSLVPCYWYLVIGTWSFSQTLPWWTSQAKSLSRCTNRHGHIFIYIYYTTII